MADVPQEKSPLLSGRDAQALEYLQICADETHAVEEGTTPSKPQILPLPWKLTKEDVLQHSNVFKPRRGKPLGDRPMHIDMDPNVTSVHAPRYRAQVTELHQVNEELRRLCDEGIIKPVTTHRLAFWPI